MEELDVEAIRTAGRIACQVKRVLGNVVKPGTPYLSLAEELENLIRRLGGEPAFPVNIGVNEEAAHYSPVVKDERKIPHVGLIKVDVGVSVNGYLADTAVTIPLGGEQEDLAKAAEDALERAIEAIRPGVRTSMVGEAIEKTIRSYGYKPVRNLSGHSMRRYVLHGGVSIPNVGGSLEGHIIRPYMLLAVEPFATNGTGLVVEKGVFTIHSLVRPLSERDRRVGETEASFLARVYAERRSLPFTERWYVGRYPLELIRRALERARETRVVASYPLLVEVGKGFVSQFEDTVLVLEKEVIITTRSC